MDDLGIVMFGGVDICFGGCWGMVCWDRSRFVVGCVVLLVVEERFCFGCFWCCWGAVLSRRCLVGGAGYRGVLCDG